jgi:hypothetical protein
MEIAAAATRFLRLPDEPKSLACTARSVSAQEQTHAPQQLAASLDHLVDLLEADRFERTLLLKWRKFADSFRFAGGRPEAMMGPQQVDPAGAGLRIVELVGHHTSLVAQRCEWVPTLPPKSAAYINT